MWYQIFCWSYTNQRYGFSSPADLSKVVVRVSVGCYFLLESINCFYWYKYHSSSLPKTSFVGFWPLHFAFTGLSFVDPEKFPLVWLQIVCGPYTNWTYRFAYPTVLWTVVSRVTVVWFCCHHQFNEWLQVNHFDFFLCVLVNIFPAVEEAIKKLGNWFINIII